MRATAGQSFFGLFPWSPISGLSDPLVWLNYDSFTCQSSTWYRLWLCMKCDILCGITLFSYYALCVSHKGQTEWIFL